MVMKLSAITWSIFIILIVSIFFVTTSMSVYPITILIIIIGILLSYRAPYLVFYSGIAFTPFLGLMVSFGTGNLRIGRAAFGGSIDVSVGEVICIFALFGWGLRVLFLWLKRHDSIWKPQLPLVLPSLSLFFAHILSLFSSFNPNPLLVLKFSVRPVLFAYLSYIALPVNFIRSRRRLVAALSAFCIVATGAALNGLIAIFFPHDASSIIGRAKPFAIFGISPIGENQNELADILVASAPLTLALAYLCKEKKYFRVWCYAAFVQAIVALCTFTRTGWIVLILQAIVLACTTFRESIRIYTQRIFVGALIVIPLAIGMVFYTFSTSAVSSTATRSMLIGIALSVFSADPVFGSGAGSFYEHVAATHIFVQEFGDALDSHGWIWKVGAETGLIGLSALMYFLISLVFFAKKELQYITSEHGKKMASLFLCSAGGGIIYQLFNTDYWTGKMWLPIGFAIVGLALSRDILER